MYTTDIPKEINTFLFSQVDGAVFASKFRNKKVATDYLRLTLNEIFLLVSLS